MEPFKMHQVELSGTPRQRGRIHGEQLREPIQAIFDFGRKGLEQAGGPPLEMIGALFQQSTGHLQAARRWTPNLVEELEGIAEGSNVDFGVLWAFQCQDESYWFSTGQIEHFPRNVDPDRCSSLGIPAKDGRPTLLAQNLDTPTLYNGAQTLLHIHYPDSDREAYIVTEPGLVGICGLNSSPLGVCQNTLAMKLSYDRDGLPAMLVARGLIDQPDLASARRFLSEIRHASGINYMLADAELVEDYECSSKQVWRFLPKAEADRLAHTNHPLVNPDWIDVEKMPEAFHELYRLSNEHSIHRMACLDHLFYGENGPTDVEGVKQVLSSHESEAYPVCRHKLPGGDIMRGMTNNSLIMQMTRPAELHISSGPPCSSEYKVFSFQGH
jgi:isopenicillin-N N-acyltransferase like protein